MKSFIAGAFAALEGDAGRPPGPDVGSLTMRIPQVPCLAPNGGGVVAFRVGLVVVADSNSVDAVPAAGARGFAVLWGVGVQGDVAEGVCALGDPGVHEAFAAFAA